jgi:hypothetical protein
MSAVSGNTLTSLSSAAMPEPDRNAVLLESLRRLVRGLSALFWGLPIALMVTVQTAIGRGEWLKPLGFLPIVIVMALLCSSATSNRRCTRPAPETRPAAGQSGLAGSHLVPPTARCGFVPSLPHSRERATRYWNRCRRAETEFSRRWRAAAQAFPARRPDSGSRE